MLLSHATASLPPLTGYTFEGYRNPDGTAGTKNILGITTTVQCVAPTVDYAVRVAREAGARTLALFHHDPAHGDDEMDRLLEGARKSAERAGVDADGAVLHKVELESKGEKHDFDVELRSAEKNVRAVRFTSTKDEKQMNSIGLAEMQIE